MYERSSHHEEHGGANSQNQSGKPSEWLFPLTVEMWGPRNSEFGATSYGSEVYMPDEGPGSATHERQQQPTISKRSRSRLPTGPDPARVFEEQLDFPQSEIRSESWWHTTARM